MYFGNYNTIAYKSDFFRGEARLFGVREVSFTPKYIEHRECLNSPFLGFK